MQIKKLDKRMNGHEHFKWVVNYSVAEAAKFVEQRTWAWNSFGPSCELDYWYRLGMKDERWCWANDQWNTRIYFATEQELNWFKLTWGVE